MAVAEPTPRLTPRQLEVLELMAKGLTNREIGRVLGIAAGTARIHVSAVIRALDVTNRTEAAVALQALRPEESSGHAVPGFGGRPAIVVLPFDEFGDDSGVFADGLAEDLTSHLAAMRWFPVISRNTAFTYRGRSIKVEEVSRELGARYVIEGSTRRSGDRVRIQVQVIDGTTGHHVFAEKFDRALGDVFAVQDEIVDAIVGTLEPVLLRVEGMRAMRAPVESLSAWEHFQRGMAIVTTQHPRETEAAVREFDAALADDPDFACAHAGRALGLFASAVYGVGNTHAEQTEPRELQAAIARAVELFGACLEASREATRLDPFDATGWIGLGSGLAMTGEIAAAASAFERALELNPSSAWGCWSYGNLFNSRERWDDAVPYLERAIRLSPHDSNRHHFEGSLAVCHFGAQRDEVALAHAQRSVECEPDSPGLSYQPLIPACLALLDRPDEGRAALAEMHRRFPHWNPELIRMLAVPAAADRMIAGIERAESL